MQCGIAAEMFGMSPSHSSHVKVQRLGGRGYVKQHMIALREEALSLTSTPGVSRYVDGKFTR